VIHELENRVAVLGDQLGRRAGQELTAALRGQDQPRRDLGEALGLTWDRVDRARGSSAWS
jgi:hypothetical protein